MNSRLWRYTLKPKCEQWFAKRSNDNVIPEDEGKQQDEEHVHNQRQVPVTFIGLREPLLEGASQ